jgi:hypothetical protein
MASKDIRNIIACCIRTDSYEIFPKGGFSLIKIHNFELTSYHVMVQNLIPKNITQKTSPKRCHSDIRKTIQTF